MCCGCSLCRVLCKSSRIILGVNAIHLETCDAAFVSATGNYAANATEDRYIISYLISCTHLYAIEIRFTGKVLVQAVAVQRTACGVGSGVDTRSQLTAKQLLEHGQTIVKLARTATTAYCELCVNAPLFIEYVCSLERGNYGCICYAFKETLSAGISSIELIEGCGGINLTLLESSLPAE